MKNGKILYFLIALLVLPLIFSCSGGGSSDGASKPPQGSKDPADIVASIRYQLANVSFSQSASIIAKVFDFNGDRVPDGTPVRFSINDVNFTNVSFAQAGPIFSNGQTVFDTVTANGFASVILSYQGVITNPCEVVLVTIRPIGYIQVFENVQVVFFSNASASYGLVLTVDDSTLPGDGFSSTTIRAKLINYFGQPAPVLSTVTFSKNPTDVGLLNGSAESVSVPTDDNGEAMVVFTSTQVANPISVLVTADAQINLSCGVAVLATSVTDIISIGLTPQNIGSITVTAEPQTIFTNGIEDSEETPNNSRITATVDDINGFPLIANTLVKFTSVDQTTGDPLGIIDPFGLTDEKGQAIVQLKAGFVGGVALVTATDSSGNVSGETVVLIKSDLEIVTESLGETTNDVTFYEAFVEATGGVPPYTWSVSPESVKQPEDIGFTFTQVENIGSFSGNPSAAGFIGNIGFAIVVEDSVGNTTTKILSFTITEAEETP